MVKPTKHRVIEETLSGIVERVTYHNHVNGWSVLKVRSFHEHELLTVTVHQMRVFAGATMKFHGHWTTHQTFGRQFKAVRAEEMKPASAAALEKYLGSGLIKGVGPKTAKKIVGHFGARTLDVFENHIDELLDINGIARKKLETITQAWSEHRAVREVMMFLQGHGISTLFAVRIYKKYGDQAIARVSENPYTLANDFYGIGFFSADRVALSLGFSPHADMRIMAAIRHVLAASREQGHCYLTYEQILSSVNDLLQLELDKTLEGYLHHMEEDDQLKVRYGAGKSPEEKWYYSKSLYYDEIHCAQSLARIRGNIDRDLQQTSHWLAQYGKRQRITLSDEQHDAVVGLVGSRCAILTGGPGCGKTTTTKTLVEYYRAMGLRVTLAAPTGRAAQRMTEVIGSEAKTIHRLLEYQGGGFKRNRLLPLETDCLVVDECSMLDISLTVSLLDAVGDGTRLIFIGDPDQLPSVGAGNVLSDMMASATLPCFTLSKVFRQAEESAIIQYAHTINRGEIPHIESPFKHPTLWTDNSDCFFIDSNEATQKQLRTLAHARKYLNIATRDLDRDYSNDHLFMPIDLSAQPTPAQHASPLPDDLNHVNFGLLQTAENSATELKAVLKKTHPWSTLHYGLTAQQTIQRLLTEWIPKYLGRDCETQVLSPMTRGSLGTQKLNSLLQQTLNPDTNTNASITLGERILRVGDRVIHRRNNYDLHVFNGDIGEIVDIDSVSVTCSVRFMPEKRDVLYQRDQLSELDLAYAITIHKSQGSEFDCVVIPIVSQHFKMLFRNLLYTGITRAKKLAVFVGTRQALALAVKNGEQAMRQTGLQELLREMI